MISEDTIAIIADDFTGAADSGIHFSRTGRRVDLLIQGLTCAEQPAECGVISLTTESRFMRPAAAAAKVASAVEHCMRAGITRFYKKIDSTLRGNPGGEIEAFLHASGRTAALICPAIPRIGRICSNGCIYLNGTPLHETETGSDPFNPISTSSVAGLLESQSSLPAYSLSVAEVESGAAALAARVQSLIRDGVRLIVADALTDTHLLTLAGQIDLSETLPVGAAGFAWALAERFKLSGAAHAAIFPTRPQGPLVAVIGSLSSVSREQADIACRSGCFFPFEIRTTDTPVMIEQAFLRVLPQIRKAGANILLRMAAMPGAAEISKTEGERVASLLGYAAAVICRNYACKTVYSTGGGTSMAVARALGIGSVALEDEIMPGVVLGSCSAPDTGVRWFISKAGGFGTRNILENIAGSVGAAGTRADTPA